MPANVIAQDAPVVIESIEARMKNAGLALFSIHQDVTPRKNILIGRREISILTALI